MITYYTNSFNINHQEFHDINLQDFYDSCLNDINIFSLECSCHHKGQFIKYGFYHRFVKTPHRVLKLKIQRLKCKHCNHTHSINIIKFILCHKKIGSCLTHYVKFCFEYNGKCKEEENYGKENINWRKNDKERSS